MYNQTTTQKARHLMKTIAQTAVGTVLLALFLVGVNVLANIIATYVPWLSFLLLGAFFSYISVVIYQELRQS